MEQINQLLTELRALYVEVVHLRKEIAEITRPNITLIRPSFKTNADAVNKLKRALERGGPLHTETCTSTELNKFSNHWRVLLRDLKRPVDDPKRSMAESILHDVGVAYKDGPFNARSFYKT